MTTDAIATDLVESLSAAGHGARRVTVVVIAFAWLATGCALPAPVTATESDGAVVSGTEFSRGRGGEKRYVECVIPTGDRYRVEVPADVADRAQQGQPCPVGPSGPLAKDQYPELYEELIRQLPYGGGDLNTCGEWQTVSRARARRLAEQCPPLKWGDLG